MGDDDRGVVAEDITAVNMTDAGLIGSAAAEIVPEPMFAEGNAWPLQAYWAGHAFCAPFLRLWLAQRVRSGKEDPRRFRERLGLPSALSPQRPVVWIHAHGSQAASAARTLMDSLIDRHLVLVTSTTRPAADFLEPRLPAEAIHQYAPLDQPGPIRRFLDHWRPAAALWVDSPLSPNMLSEVARRQIPAALVNGRLGDADFRRLMWRKPLYRPILRTFALMAAQSGRDGARLRVLSGRHVYRFGNLQHARPEPRVDEILAAKIKHQLRGRLIWAAVYTHPGEEEIIAEAHRKVCARLPNALLILAPRHAHRVGEIGRNFAKSGGCVRAATGDVCDETTSVLLLEGPEQAALACRLAPVAFLGGSLKGRGGHNPLELAHMGSAVISGPNNQNYIEPMAELQAAGAVEIVRDATTLSNAVVRLLKDLDFARQRAAAADRVADHEWVAMTRLLAAIEPILPRLKQ